MNKQSLYIPSDRYGRFYEIPYKNESDIVILPRRINSGIDFAANREARKCILPDRRILDLLNL